MLEPRHCPSHVSPPTICGPHNRVRHSHPASRWLACPQAEAGPGLHRTTSRGRNFSSCAGERGQAQSLSFCARLQDVFRPAATSIPRGSSHETGRAIAVAFGASGIANWSPDRLSRNEFIHASLSQVCGHDTKRISAPTRELTSRLPRTRTPTRYLTGLVRDRHLRRSRCNRPAPST